MITLLNKFDDGYVIKEEDVYSIVSSYKEEKKLDNKYLVNIDFNGKKLNYPAYYCLKDKKIYFDDKKIILNGYALYDKLNKLYQTDEDSYSYYLNNYYLYVIYHELFHAEQLKRHDLDLPFNEIHNYLFDLCSLLRHGNREFYDKNHNLFPMEIESITTGYFKAYNLMLHTKLSNRECKIMYLKFLKTLLDNYSISESDKTIIISPIEVLSTKTELIDLNKINELMSKVKLSKIDRLNLGLPITYKEYDSVKKEQDKVKSYVINKF